MMLLILILNNVVDKMLPCGTPCESLNVSDKVDSKFRDNMPAVSGEDFFEGVIPYMGMVAILVM